MKNKIKKILTTSLVSAMTITTLSAGASKLLCPEHNELANANHIQNENVATIQETISNNTNKNKIGKIVETSVFENDGFNTYTRPNGATYLNNTSDTQTSSNTLNSNENSMSLFVLSESPYIELSNDNNGSRLSMYINFSKDSFKLNPTSYTQNNDNGYCFKQAILTMYTNELYNGNISLSSDKQTEIESLIAESNNPSANRIDRLIDILESSLNSNSTYYGKNLSSLSATINSNNSVDGQYKTLADKIVSAFKLQSNTASNTTETNQQLTRNNQSTKTQNNSNLNTIQNNQTISRNRTLSNNDNTNQSQTGNINQSQSQTNNVNQPNTLNNQSLTQETQNGFNQSNNMTQNNRNSSTRRRYYNRQSLNNGYNQNTNNSSYQTTQNQSQNRTMRADRTPNQDYISGKSGFQSNNRPIASRTPYTQNQMVR